LFLLLFAGDIQQMADLRRRNLGSRRVSGNQNSKKQRMIGKAQMTLRRLAATELTALV
jgi:hypothetical protein